MSERRYTEQEEALEIKSLRRILAAYAKYANPHPPLPLSSTLPGPRTNRPPVHSRRRRHPGGWLEVVRKQRDAVLETVPRAIPSSWPRGATGWHGVWTLGVQQFALMLWCEL